MLCMLIFYELTKLEYLLQDVIQVFLKWRNTNIWEVFWQKIGNATPKSERVLKPSKCKRSIPNPKQSNKNQEKCKKQINVC